MRIIPVALFVILFLIIGIPVLGIEWLIGKISKKTMDYSSLRIVQWAFKVIIRLAGIELTVIGEENVPDEPVLFIGNHRSYFDIVITYARCRNLTGYIAKKEMLSIPLLRTWMKRLYCLFINRDDVKEALKTILAGIDHIKNGISMCIFPEGTRSRTGHMLPLLGGASLLALKSGCDVVPIYIEGSYKPFHRMIVHVGRPVEMADLRAGRMNRETCDELTRRMEAEFAQLSGGKSLPPAEA